LFTSNIEAKILNPSYLTGFSEGEGCFSFSIIKNKSKKIGRAVRFSFTLVAAKNPENVKNLN